MPELESMRQARKIKKGVCMLNLLASLRCDFNNATTFVPDVSGKPVSLPKRLVTRVGAAKKT